MPMKQSDELPTPRTDYAATLIQFAVAGKDQYEVVTAEFARQLERELSIRPDPASVAPQRGDEGCPVCGHVIAENCDHGITGVRDEPLVDGDDTVEMAIRKAVRDIRAALKRELPVSRPLAEGMVMVPREPTEEMVDAPRQIILYAETPGRSLAGLRDHLLNCGIPLGILPPWAMTENGHLTKGAIAALVYRAMLNAGSTTGAVGSAAETASSADEQSAVDWKSRALAAERERDEARQCESISTAFIDKFEANCKQLYEINRVLIAQKEAAERQLKDVERDAERYRWLVEKATWVSFQWKTGRPLPSHIGEFSQNTGRAMDSVIDKARSLPDASQGTET